MRYLVVALIALSAAACGSTAPVAPPSSVATSVEAAEVFVGGSPVGGGAISGDVGSSLFQLRLRDRDPVHLQSVDRCALHYELPGDGLLAFTRSGEQPFFDDGSHGDDVPGDGIYHWLDADDAIGIGRSGAPAGEYRYRFQCAFQDGSESGVDLTVTRQCGLPPWDEESPSESAAPSC